MCKIFHTLDEQEVSNLQSVLMNVPFYSRICTQYVTYQENVYAESIVLPGNVYRIVDVSRKCVNRTIFVYQTYVFLSDLVTQKYHYVVNMFS